MRRGVCCWRTARDRYLGAGRFLCLPLVTEEDVRRVALSLPGGIERPYYRLPSFRVCNNLFLRVHELPDAFFVRCASVEERDELLRAEPGKFFSTPHYDGYPGVLLLGGAPVVGTGE